MGEGDEWGTRGGDRADKRAHPDRQWDKVTKELGALVAHMKTETKPTLGTPGLPLPSRASHLQHGSRQVPRNPMVPLLQGLGFCVL
jgi:hypothetical protein